MGWPKGKPSSNRIDILGHKFGRLTVIEPAHTEKKLLHWKCVCDCGRECLIKGSSLRMGVTTSCGCRLAEVHAQAGMLNLKHGKTRTKTNIVWQNMRRRCYQKSNISYKNYGAKGITVCERWNSYENFLADMGECPDEMSLDRIDCLKGYSPENCRWADLATQALNRTDVRQFTAHGLTMAMPEWCRLTGINYATLYKRLVTNGWEPERAIPPPVDRKFSAWKVEEV
jgi:hypothetical protein